MIKKVYLFKKLFMWDYGHKGHSFPYFTIGGRKMWIDKTYYFQELDSNEIALDKMIRCATKEEIDRYYKLKKLESL